MLVETLYSLISTGTELACLSGGESWFQMPAVPGYCCVSKVLEAGEDAPYKEGDLIFHYGMHSRYQLTSPDSYNLVVKVPEGLDLRSIPMVRMATIAFTSIRVSEIELGDVVLVSGLGLVGNMAAQLAHLSGAVVIGVDPAPSRRELAEKVGIDCAGGDYETNLAEVLRCTHLDELGCVTLKGAHEWRIPTMRERYVKHSIERNTMVCFDQIRRGKLHLKELVSHVLTPEEAADVYLKLNEDRNAYLGIIIDWSKA